MLLYPLNKYTMAIHLVKMEVRFVAEVIGMGAERDLSVSLIPMDAPVQLDIWEVIVIQVNIMYYYDYYF